MIRAPSKLLALGCLLLCTACVAPSIAGESAGAESLRLSGAGQARPAKAFAGESAGAESLRLSASSMSVQAGEAVILNWQTGGPRAYLSGVGVVDAEGTAIVKPRFTTTYSLITDFPFLKRDITIALTGIKGEEDELPKQTEYYGHHDHIKSVSSLTVYLGALRHLLQDRMKFVLYDYSRNNTYLFKTHLSETSEFLPPKEDGVLSQRIAFLVTVTELPAEYCASINSHTTGSPGSKNAISTKAQKACIRIGVSTSLKYRRLSEDTWRINNNTDVNGDRASAILSAVTQIE